MCARLILTGMLTQVHARWQAVVDTHTVTWELYVACDWIRTELRPFALELTTFVSSALSVKLVPETDTRPSAMAVDLDT
jgi:hypothetical protein